MNDIFHDSKSFLVAYKPQNISINKYELELKQRFNLSYLKSVYSLDNLAGGVVVLAKTEAAYKMLLTQYNNGEFDFNFYAVVVGDGKQNNGVINTFCARDSKAKRLSRVPQLTQNALHIVFDYEFLDRVQQIALVKLRTNMFFDESVRFSCFDLGSPIFGDAVYGGDSLAKNTNLGLVLGVVRFKSLDSNENLNFVALPNENKPWTYFDVKKWFGVIKGGNYGR